MPTVPTPMAAPLTITFDSTVAGIKKYLSLSDIDPTIWAALPRHYLRQRRRVSKKGTAVDAIMGRRMVAIDRGKMVPPDSLVGKTVRVRAKIKSYRYKGIIGWNVVVTRMDTLVAAREAGRELAV